jgi:hypothetical protein
VPQRPGLKSVQSTFPFDGIAFMTNGAFVASEGVGAAPGKVDVYDLAAKANVATVNVGQQAGGIAFWKMKPCI